MNGFEVLDMDMWCDGRLDCSDLSDEIYCGRYIVAYSMTIV